MVEIFANNFIRKSILFNLKNLICAIILDGKVSKVDDKKVPTAKPAFSGSSQAPQRKDSTAQKFESQPSLKSDDSSKSVTISSQVPQTQRAEKTPPYAGEKPQTYVVLSKIFRCVTNN